MNGNTPFSSQVRTRASTSFSSAADVITVFVYITSTAFAQWNLFLETWHDYTFYVQHFTFESYLNFDLALRFLYMVCLLLMGVFFADDPKYHFCFIASYAFLKIVYIAQHIKLYKIERTRRYARDCIVITSMSLIVCIICMVINRIPELIGRGPALCAWEHLVIYGLLFIVDVAVGLVGEAKQIQLRVNMPHMVERNGLFFLVILGESIISVMNTKIGPLTVDGFPTLDDLIIFLMVCTFLISFVIGTLYFSTQPSEELMEEEKELMTPLMKSYSNWTLHLVLFQALLGWGVGMKIAGKHLFDEERQVIDLVLPGISLVVIHIGLLYIRWCNPFRAGYLVFGARVAVIIIMLVACCLAEIIPQMAIFMTLVCGTVAIYAMDVEGRAQHQHEKEHIKPKDHAVEFSSRRQLVSRSAKYSVIDEEDEDSHDNIGVDDIEFEEEEDDLNNAEESIDTSTVDIEG